VRTELTQSERTKRAERDRKRAAYLRSAKGQAKGTKYHLDRNGIRVMVGMFMLDRGRSVAQVKRILKEHGEPVIRIERQYPMGQVVNLSPTELADPNCEWRMWYRQGDYCCPSWHKIRGEGSAFEE